MPSQRINAPGYPDLPDPPHLLGKLPTRDPLGPHSSLARLVRVIEGVLQQPDVRRLHGPKHDLQLPLAESHPSSRRRPGLASPCRRAAFPDGVQGPAAHVDYGNELDARVGLPPVRGQPVVDGVQEAEVAAEKRARGGRVALSRGEYVEGTGEQEGELQRRAQGHGLAGRGVVRGWEEGRMERTVLFLAFSLAEGGYGKIVSELTFRPMTPRQAIAGIDVAIVTRIWLSTALVVKFLRCGQELSWSSVSRLPHHLAIFQSGT
ncbi:hypothetical protein SUNI508_12582 [Seiridium unicorne]|uniref:Uncharacterized protein n=1 Tax=Seiridium unicorne TaxID=138068 RepID=A0ABR2VGS5_9PEZI